MNEEEFTETSKFSEMFDNFFDCMNTRSKIEGKKKRTPDLDPYRSVEDPRFDVKIKIPVLKFWFVVVVARKQFPKLTRRMCSVKGRIHRQREKENDYQ